MLKNLNILILINNYRMSKFGALADKSLSPMNTGSSMKTREIFLPSPSGKLALMNNGDKSYMGNKPEIPAESFVLGQNVRPNLISGQNLEGYVKFDFLKIFLMYL